MLEYLVYVSPADKPMNVSTLKGISSYLQQKYQPVQTPAAIQLIPTAWITQYRSDYYWYPIDGLGSGNCGTQNPTTGEYTLPIPPTVRKRCWIYCKIEDDVVQAYWLTSPYYSSDTTYSGQGVWESGLARCGKTCPNLGMPENT